jgi:hypothetical protein
MAHDEWRKDLRIAAAQHDAQTIARLLDEQLPAEGLQHAGDAALCALAAAPHTAHDVATPVADALRERSWDGDEELADAIDTALGQRVTTLTPLDVDLDFIADALTEPAGSVGYLDLHTGFVTTEAMFDNGDRDDNTDLEDRSRWLPVTGAGSDEPYQIMRRFIATAPDQHTRWQRYTDDARLGRARSWLADHGYQPETR